MRCPPISQHHRRGRRAGAEASRLINEAGHAPRIGAGNGALGQETARGSGARPAHWGRQRRTGAGNDPGIRGTPRVLGQATAHWGRQRPGNPGHTPCIGAGNGALGQANCLLQCLFSCPNAAHQTRERTAAVVPSHGVRPRTRRRRPDQANGDHQRCRQTAFNTRPVGAPFSQRYRDPCGRLRGLSRTAALFSQQYHTFAEIPRFASVITLAKCGIPLKTPLHLQTSPRTSPTPEKRWDSGGKFL